MHSSRMRTGRALTVSGGMVHPRIFWGEKNEKKFGDPPPKNWRHPPPPKNWKPPLLTESQTGVKILPWPNFVAAGKNADPHNMLLSRGNVANIF